MLNTLVYKLYVIVLLIFVVWAAQFIYPLIYWEFEYTGVEKQLILRKGETDLAKMRKIRLYMDNYSRVRSHDLGDVEFEEHYEKGHFHHIGQKILESSLNGCDYCHTIFAHNNGKEVRAFRNMHGYFLACETCHFEKRLKPKRIKHGWIRVKTEKKIQKPLALLKRTLTNKGGLPKAKGNYGARIIPLTRSGGQIKTVVSDSSKSEALKLLKKFDKMSEFKVQAIVKEMHKNLTKKPLTCDACHTNKKPAISYASLGYDKKASQKLKDAAVAGVISKYDKFHFPNLFIRKDERSREKILDSDD